MTLHKHALAKLFSERLLATIGSDKLAEVVRLNSNEPNPSICHSHSFCDSNETMLEAWVFLFGGEIDLQSDEHCALWDAAWNLAKRNNFAV